MPWDGRAAVGESGVVLRIIGIRGEGASVVGVGEEDALAGGDGVCEIGVGPVGGVFGADGGDGVVLAADTVALGLEVRADVGRGGDEFDGEGDVEVGVEVALVDGVGAGFVFPGLVVARAAGGVFHPRCAVGAGVEEVQVFVYR